MRSRSHSAEVMRGSFSQPGPRSTPEEFTTIERIMPPDEQQRDEFFVDGFGRKLPSGFTQDPLMLVKRICGFEECRLGSGLALGARSNGDAHKLRLRQTGVANTNCVVAAFEFAASCCPSATAKRP